MTEYELYLERKWEARQQAMGLKRGLKFGGLMIAPFWILFLYFWLR